MEVELQIYPAGTSICYLNMSAIPRKGEKLTIFVDDDHFGCSAKVEEVIWPIALDETNEDDANCVVVVAQLDPEDDEFEYTNLWLERDIDKVCGKFVKREAG